MQLGNGSTEASTNIIQVEMERGISTGGERAACDTWELRKLFLKLRGFQHISIFMIFGDKGLWKYPGEESHFSVYVMIY